MKKNILPVEQSREYLLSMLENGTKSAADTGGTDTASGGYGAARSKKQKVAALIRPELTIPAGAETDADTGGYWDEEADARYDAFLKDYEKTAVPAGAETDARTDGEGDALSGEQKLDAKIAAKLPESFPVDEWETLTTKQQLKAMQFSGLTNEEQWRLLNASMPLKELASIGGWESDSDDTGTDSSKSTSLQQRILDRQLEKEEEAMRSASGQGDEELPNAENVRMYNYGKEEPYTLKENEYYYVEEASSYWYGLVYVVVGRTVLFDGAKYATYSYVGVSKGASVINYPYNHTWSKGVVQNVKDVEDYAGAFVNGNIVTGPAGYSASIGGHDNEVVIAITDVMEELFPSGSVDRSLQWYVKSTDDWVYDTAPITWGDTFWDNYMNPYPDQMI